jgi:hypothetical protein
VYALSVFTHLDEAHQFQWLAELERILRPGGYLLVSLHELSADVPNAPVLPSHAQETGFMFAALPSGGMRGIFPDWYQIASHSEAYVRANYARYFSVVDYAPHGLDHSQDVVVLQKR